MKILKKNKIHICVASPKNYSHVRAFDEIQELLFWSLNDLGVEVTLANNRCDPDKKNIIFGAHLLSGSDLTKLPEETVVINTEPLHATSSNWANKIFSLRDTTEIWDYSASNVSLLRAKGFSRTKFLPLGFHRALARLSKMRVQDIDILFYGSLTPRRLNILRKLKSDGLNVTAVYDVYGSERDKLIERSKVILNIHAYENGAIESPRLFYLLTNSKAVVSENVSACCSTSCQHLRPYFSDEFGISEVCRLLVERSELRSKCEAQAFDAVSAVDQTVILSSLLGLARANNYVTSEA